tara:strand:- start:941 stop:1264 length:324 start_codon:yes stop_codon:yes gene_type:complete
MSETRLEDALIEAVNCMSDPSLEDAAFAAAKDAGEWARTVEERLKSPLLMLRADTRASIVNAPRELTFHDRVFLAALTGSAASTTWSPSYIIERARAIADEAVRDDA